MNHSLDLVSIQLFPAIKRVQTVCFLLDIGPNNHCQLR